MVRDDRPPMGLEGTSPPPEMADDGYGYVSSPGKPQPRMGGSRPGPRGLALSSAAAQTATLRGSRMTPPGSPGGGGGGGGEHTNGYYEVYPRGGGRKPALLVQLESLLSEQLRLSEKLASVKGGIHGSDYRDESGALALEAHRAVFDAFINAFTTYRPLLTKVKEHYDRSLDRALRSEHENVQMRSELKAMELRKGREVETARAEAIATAATFRGDVQQRLAKQTARAEEAEKERDEARAQIERLVAELEAAKATCGEAVEQARVLKEAALKESSWAQDPAMESMMALSVGPVPKNFARADATLIDGEGGLTVPKEEGEEPPAGEGEEPEPAGEEPEATPETEAEADAKDA